MPKITIHNVETNEVIEREMTDAELKQYNADQIQYQKDKEAKLAAEATRKAIIEKLGLTSDEIKVLLG